MNILKEEEIKLILNNCSRSDLYRIISMSESIIKSLPVRTDPFTSEHLFYDKNIHENVLKGLEEMLKRYERVFNSTNEWFSNETVICCVREGFCEHLNKVKGMYNGFIYHELKMDLLHEYDENRYWYPVMKGCRVSADREEDRKRLIPRIEHIRRTIERVKNIETIGK